MFPEVTFEQIYKRSPTREDRERLLSVKAALGLSNRDELWPLIITLDHYSSTTEAARQDIISELNAFPGLVQSAINNAAKGAASAASKSASVQVEAIIERGADRLSSLVLKRSETTAQNISRRSLIISMIAGACIAALLVAAGAAGAFYLIDELAGICSHAPRAAQDGSMVCYVR